MLFSTEYIVYLWLLPVTLFIIIPLLVSAIWLISFCLKEMLAGRIPFVSQFLASHYSAKNGLQQVKPQDTYPGETVQA